MLTIARARFLWLSFHFDGTFGTCLCSKYGVHLKHDCATRVAGSKWLKNRVSMQLDSRKRYRSDQASDRFEGSCTSKRVPNVLHMWRPKGFQMCRTFGVSAKLRQIARARF